MFGKPFAKKRKKRSPLDKPPLRHAGQSLHEAASELLTDRYYYWTGLTLAMWVMVLSDLGAWYWNMPRAPLVVIGACVALLVTVIGVVQIVRLIPKARAIQQGRHGEMLVAEMLEGLRAEGYHAFHDLQEDGYNIDHVLIGPGGVFAIETKTLSKPDKGDPRVVYDGRKVTIAGHEPDRDPLKQAQANARRVRDILKEMTGRELWVHPVVLFPGWFVVNTTRNGEVRVANPTYFARSFDHEHGTGVLGKEDVQLLVAGMERYARGQMA